MVGRLMDRGKYVQLASPSMDARLARWMPSDLFGLASKDDLSSKFLRDAINCPQWFVKEENHIVTSDVHRCSMKCTIAWAAYCMQQF